MREGGDDTHLVWVVYAPPGCNKAGCQNLAIAVIGWFYTTGPGANPGEAANFLELRLRIERAKTIKSKHRIIATTRQAPRACIRRAESSRPASGERAAAARGPPRSYRAQDKVDDDFGQKLGHKSGGLTGLLGLIGAGDLGLRSHGSLQPRLSHCRPSALWSCEREFADCRRAV
jgi:hypothetical protein